MATPRASRGIPTGTDLADELWTPAQLATYLHCGRSTAYATVHQPDFPIPVSAGGRRLWVGYEVRAWVLSAGRVREPGPAHAPRDGTASPDRRRSR